MIAAIAASLDGIPFEEMGAASLLDRVDTKYLFAATDVGALLADETGDYRVLTFGGRRISRYRTDYFDTPELDAYRDHQNGREPRFKVRVRAYLDSDLTFLEVKWKTSRGRTVKVREPFHNGWDSAVGALLNGPSAALVAPVPWARLRPSIRVDYDRLTLVSRHRAERVTIDLRLAYRDAGEAAVYPGLAIAEVKQDRVSRVGFTAALRRRRVREVSLSKYCLGVARLHPDRVKTNGYRLLLERLNQMGGPDDAPAIR